MDNKAQLTLNSMNSISSGTLLYEKGDPVDSISLLVKGRVRSGSLAVCAPFWHPEISLGICVMWNGDAPSLHIRQKDDAVVSFVLPVNGLDSVRKLLVAKPEYCGLLCYFTELFYHRAV